MKYIISENRLHEFMRSYLDTFLESKKIVEHPPFIVISDRPDNEDEAWVDYMEYDRSDGRLWINKDFLLNFMDLFAHDKEQAQTFISEWFEQEFEVGIKFVE